MGGAIRQNIERVRERIERAARRAGRNPDEVKIIAVTKGVEPAGIIEAIDAGIFDLGENRVQEMLGKQAALKDMVNRPVNWHMIGHLQNNKVKYLAGSVSMIHSLDSMKLAREIDKKAEMAGKVMDVLVQVNVAEEETKFGLKKHEVLDFIKEISTCRNMKVRGLMAIAPYVENPEDARLVFRELRKLFIDIGRKNIDNIDMDYLSMGMSKDFEVAVEEGANIVRIGTAIFGKRQVTHCLERGDGTP
ncbi:MAG: YggS family pyridoxal phosphate-dependent enzyme [Clostridiaceae bacterium]|nr:YggS family pyridoxal phosphate-dependent enzyme [Clostridiaceae bacterium]